MRLVAVSVLLVGLTACSGSASSSAPATGTTTTRAAVTTSTAAAPGPDALEHAVDRYTAAFGTGDGRVAWAIVSARCQSVINETDYRAQVAASGVKYAGLHVTHYDGSIDGSAATVNYDTSSSSISEHAQRWVLEQGAWHYDGC